MENKSKTNTVLLVIIIILLVLGLGYYFLNNSKLKGGEVLDNKESQTTEGLIMMQTFSKEDVPLSFKYPIRLGVYESSIYNIEKEYALYIGSFESLHLQSVSNKFPEYNEIEVRDEKTYQLMKDLYKGIEYTDVIGNDYFIAQGMNDSSCGDMGIICFDRYLGIKKMSDNIYGLEYVLVTGKTEVISMSEFKEVIESIILKNNSENQDNLTCNESPDYLAISRRIIGETGSDLLIKYKTSAGQKISCNYFVEKNDFELKNNGGANYFMAFEGKFLIMDEGTAVNNRGMNIYDLSKKSKIFSDRYSSGEPIIKNNTITYWINTNEAATIENCSQLYNSGGAIVSQVSLDLSTLVRKDLGNKRCAYQD